MHEKFEVHIEQNDKGEKTCTVNSLRLHSKYNPKQEAVRNIEKLLHEKNISSVEEQSSPKLIIMIGAGLGYELEALHTKFPQSHIFPIYFNHTLYNESTVARKSIFNPPVHNDLTHSLRNILLSQQLQPLENKDIRVLYWPPSTRIWKHYMTPCIREVKDVIEMHIAEKNTINHFLSQWMRNACFHFLHINTWNIPYQTHKPIVVCGAGPSLNDSIHEIKKKREHIALMATSSTLHCLKKNEVYPDIIVHQDSSYYSAKYLIDVSFEYKPLIAYPLHTSRNAILRKFPSIILNSQQEAETLLNIGNSHTIQVSPHATVVGTAIELAWQLTDNTVFLAGFDLSVESRGNHCYPHIQDKIYQRNKLDTLDTYLLANYFNAEHTLPLPHRNMKQSNSLKIFSDWFIKWQHPNKSQKTFMLGDYEYPHYIKGQVTNKLPIMQGSSRNPIFPIKHTRKFDYDAQGESLRNLISQWEEAWSSKKNMPSSKMSCTIQNIKNTISEDTFNNIVSTIESYIKPSS